MRLTHTVRSVQNILTPVRRSGVKELLMLPEIRTTDDYTFYDFFPFFVDRFAFRQSCGEKDRSKRLQTLFYSAIHNCKLITAAMIRSHKFKRNKGLLTDSCIALNYFPHMLIRRLFVKNWNTGQPDSSAGTDTVSSLQWPRVWFHPVALCCMLTPLSLLPHLLAVPSMKARKAKKYL